jgi:ABC-type spermidine/putrescine transport system permease subunit I
MTHARSQALLMLPVALVLGTLLVLPMVMVGDESFRAYTPGRIGSVENAPLTFTNYLELLHPAYVRYFVQTYLLSLTASLLAVFFAFPISYHIARNTSGLGRKVWISGIIGLMFLSALVRVYAIQLTFGSTGIVSPMLSAVGINMNSWLYINTVIIAGILHYAIPMSVLILIGAIQNLNPRLTDAAQSLGASVLTTHLTVTLPLCIRGLVSAFLVSMTLGISAFVIPWILGRGRVLFVSNLVYSRFSEAANYPSGAAISIVMMVLSVFLIFALSRLATMLDRT